MSSICAYRNECGRKYTIALADQLGLDWLESYHTFASGEMEIWEKFALLHPDHNSEHGESSIRIMAWDKLRGPNCFPPKGSPVVGCEAVIVWGYQCPNISENLEQDHLFPYSLGGITSDHNRIWLCRYHNMLKGNDVHCYPWEEAANRAAWVDRHIAAIHKKVYLNRQF